MAETTPQTYANHVRLDPLFHFFLLPVAALTIGVSVFNVIQHVNYLSIWMVVLAIAFAVLVVKTRVYALKAQDRVIRLEERLRMATVLPEPLRQRVDELTESQLIALRFAPDAELPALVEKAATDKMGSSDIKKAIRNWRPDYFRI